MKLFKPPWITHDDKPIFSIDIHPDESRFATGGQGDGGSSGKVIIWNMTPVVNQKDEVNDKIPKVLCVMDNHLACVNSVRWSCNGRYLASGGDDRLIMIWQFAGYGGAGVFGGQPTLKTSTGERWRCTHTLKGHTGDVLDLAWSPGNQWLASCSIDNSVVIWDVEKFPAITTVLKGHTSLVKGVTWDPIGSYVASQSDDKTVKVWKTLDWKLETTITKPFDECTATTHVLRLSWSPDGGILVSAHAMNNSGPTAQIIDRDGWKTDMDFVGHRKAITCTRFNSCMFSKLKTEGESKPYTCCAVGSRDRSLSVWLTSLQRPLVVVHDLFDNSVMDISWSFSGYSLLCCSWDGTVAYIQFTPQELGQTLTQEEKNKLHKETYGKTSTMVSQPLIIENPAMLAIQEKKNDSSVNDQNEKLKPPTTPIKYPTKQIETRTPSGKRRIIPVFVAPQEALGGIPRPFGSSSPFGKSNSSSNLSKSMEKFSDHSSNESPLKVVDKSKTSPHQNSSDKNPTTLKKNENESNIQPNAVQSSVTGKEKTQESFSSPAKLDNDTAHQKKKAVLDSRLCEKTLPSVVKEKLVPRSVHFNEQLEPAKNSPKIPPPPSSLPPSPSIIKPTDSHPPVFPRRPGRPPLHLKRKQGSLPASPGRKKHKIGKDNLKNLEDLGTRHDEHEKEVHHPLTKTTPTPRHTITTNVLPALKLTKKLTASCPKLPGTIIHIHNELNSDDKLIASALHKIICCVDKDEVWTSVMSAPATAVSLSRLIVCIGCSDHTVCVLSTKSGRQMLPQICFASSSSPLALLQCRGHFVMAVDALCNLSIWNTQNGSVVIDNKSFLNQIISNQNKPTSNSSEAMLQKCSLTDRGLPLITLSNNKALTYDVSLAAWIFVSLPGDSIEQFTDHITVTHDHSHDEDDINGLLSKKFSSGMGCQAGRTFHATASAQRDATLVSLERKLSASLLLQSASHYKRWLLAYVRYLVQGNYDLRLREVCDDLIGPPADRTISDNHVSWKPYILGLSKRMLLREEVLPVIGANLSFQRMYTEYHDQLELAEDSSDDDRMEDEFT
uniref:protein HIRA-like n=1 Tax=Ciona intestinalis TaxID=7719 RepID=UPI000180BF89|nr:protein HIRA-like [Ciona intestinalis]|eukprot:XP_002127462.1 protein HIRA-like [Ciona intestinalis]